MRHVVRCALGNGLLLGQDLGSGLDVYLKEGPFGEYVQLGDASAANPRRAAVVLKGCAPPAAGSLSTPAASPNPEQKK